MACCDECGEMGVQVCVYCGCCDECCPEFHELEDEFENEPSFDDEQV